MLRLAILGASIALLMSCAALRLGWREADQTSQSPNTPSLTTDEPSWGLAEWLGLVGTGLGILNGAWSLWLAVVRDRQLVRLDLSLSDDVVTIDGEQQLRAKVLRGRLVNRGRRRVQIVELAIESPTGARSCEERSRFQYPLSYQMPPLPWVLEEEDMRSFVLPTWSFRPDDVGLVAVDTAGRRWRLRRRKFARLLPSILAAAEWTKERDKAETEKQANRISPKR